MRIRATVLLAAAAATLTLAACDPAATSPTQNSTAAAVPANTGAPAAGAAPAAAGDTDKLKDVEITNCTVDATLHWPSAELKITNHSAKASNYIVHIEFVDASGTRIAEGIGATNNLAPNQGAVVKATGPSEVTGKISCRTADVTRYAAG
ncbi:hypothetical protein GCM10010441_62340 [Kitasatospora paracochleata]|uniref:Lipoprotein n=1 Tax=Kitasatospora paracochleata TaxID=58354 RepID=A0ABT1J0C8_9ACTN|nr:hypothetical protein [Kitasatospora paracochleata]MCP2310561.1 hypothetical protein [Kitasatospora paracochleata]